MFYSSSLRSVKCFTRHDFSFPVQFPHQLTLFHFVPLPATPALTDKDKRDLKWSCEVGADFVAASFIRTASNVRSVKAYLDRCIASMSTPADGAPLPLRPLVISKIESKEGVDNFDEVLEESDGIMVARGDLGVGELSHVKLYVFKWIYTCTYVLISFFILIRHCTPTALHK